MQQLKVRSHFSDYNWMDQPAQSPSYNHHSFFEYFQKPFSLIWLSFLPNFYNESIQHNQDLYIASIIIVINITIPAIWHDAKFKIIIQQQFYQQLVSCQQRPIKMIRNYSKAKQQQHFKSLSPRYPSTTLINIDDRDQQEKLQKKINKLKMALHAAEKHNQQLHTKIRLYREDYNQEIQKNKLKDKEYMQLSKKYHEQLSQSDLKGKSKKKDVVLKEKRIEQLQKLTKENQSTIEQLQQQIRKQKQRVTQLETMLSTQKQKDGEHFNEKIKHIEKQLALKIVANNESTREVSHLKQSLKQSLYKIDKMTIIVESHNSKNKKLEEDNKQLKKIIQVYQKQSGGLHQTMERDKVKAIEYIENIGKLEKQIQEINHTNDNLQHKNKELEDRWAHLKEEFDTLKRDYQSLEQKYTHLINANYDMQRDFERQLHTIVKELTRRHIVSKSMITSLGSSIVCPSPYKEDLKCMQGHNMN